MLFAFTTIARVVKSQHSPGKPRNFSFISIHRTLPATLHSYQIHRGSRLYDEKSNRVDNEFDRPVEITNFGMVHPAAKGHCTVSGTHFQPGNHSSPNIFLLQI